MAEKYMELSANELVQIVNEANEPIYSCKRAEMRKNRLIHRATYAFIKNSSGHFYVQKRSKYKDYCPLFFDPTPGGVVASGESYEETNRREVEEEMGIAASTPMEHLFTFYFEDNRIRCFGDAWELTYDGELKLQKEEVESVHMMTMEEIIRRADAGENFTPDSVHACREYLRHKSAHYGNTLEQNEGPSNAT